MLGVLQAVHDAGLVHRDVKPANVMFVTEPGAEPRLKLIDFGIAQGTEDETRLTRTGMLVGTAGFCSPEQVLGQPLDGRSDQYAAGVLLYRMFTGVLPYASDGTANVLFSHVQKPAPPFRVRAPGCTVLPTVETVVLRALSKDPAERYPSMRALGDALVAALPEVEGDLARTQPSTAAVSRGVAAVAPVAKRAPDETTRQWAAVFRYALSKEDGATLLEAWEAAKGGLATVLSVNELVAVGRAAAGVSRFELARDCFTAAAEARGPAEEVAGARVMLARLLDERLGCRADARKWMERVVADTPGSAAGRYAAEWLTRVGSA